MCIRDSRGTLSSKASTITFYQDDKKIGTSDVKALAAGESTTIRFNAGNLDAGEYAISAVVDEDNKVIEKREDNNLLAMSGKVTVKEVESVDIVPIASWSPSNPGIGDEVNFTVTVSNKGNQNTADLNRTVTVKIKDENGSVVKTLSSVVSGKINEMCIRDRYLSIMEHHIPSLTYNSHQQKHHYYHCSNHTSCR